MEKSPFALSVDNSLLDSIHPLSNSNSRKFPTPCNRVYTYCINKQTRKHTAAQLPALVIRMCTYTSPRNKPDAEGKSGLCWYVCLENKNASFETCILNSPDSPLFATAVPIHPMCTPPLCLSVVTASCHWQSTFASMWFSRIFLPAFETSPACGFFVSFYVYLVPQYFSNSPNNAREESIQQLRGCTFNIASMCVFLYSIYALFFPSKLAVGKKIQVCIK